jgi:hypothetical protein
MKLIIVALLMALAPTAMAATATGNEYCPLKKGKIAIRGPTAFSSANKERPAASKMIVRSSAQKGSQTQ